MRTGRVFSVLCRNRENKNHANLFHLHQTHACWLYLSWKQMLRRCLAFYKQPEITVWTKTVQHRIATAWSNRGHFLCASMTFNQRYKFRSQTIWDIFSSNRSGSNCPALLNHYSIKKKKKKRRGTGKIIGRATQMLFYLKFSQERDIFMMVCYQIIINFK